MTTENEPAENDPRVAEEEQRAAAEAARIGGRYRPESDDPAQEPLAEAGQGEAEGFELAEKELEESASHGDSRGFPDEDIPAPEEPTEAEYGEPDEPIPSDSSQSSGDEE
jgi:hypothetical protein